MNSLKLDALKKHIIAVSFRRILVFFTINSPGVVTRFILLFLVGVEGGIMDCQNMKVNKSEERLRRTGIQEHLFTAHNKWILIHRILGQTWPAGFAGGNSGKTIWETSMNMCLNVKRPPPQLVAVKHQDVVSLTTAVKNEEQTRGRRTRGAPVSLLHRWRSQQRWSLFSFTADKLDEVGSGV